VARSHGNLFRAPAEPGGIDGGLRSSRRVPIAATAAVCVLGIAVAALVLGGPRSPSARGR
jgi:hypothetical protein